MIYDKNQFMFNVTFVVILIVIIGCFAFLGMNYYNMKKEIKSLNNTLAQVEKNQNYINYIQGAHSDINYLLTPKGFFIEGADDFATLNDEFNDSGRIERIKTCITNVIKDIDAVNQVKELTAWITQ